MSSFLETQGGHLGIIQCTTESDPEANLTLWRGQEVIACTWGCPAAPNPRVHATLSYNSLKVEIREVVLEDEGTYVCWAGNPQGNASAAVDFRAESECGGGAMHRIQPGAIHPRSVWENPGRGEGGEGMPGKEASSGGQGRWWQKNRMSRKRPHAREIQGIEQRLSRKSCCAAVAWC